MMNPVNNSPLISVVITAYNYAAYLPKAIESVLHQTYKNIELIVIDDGSVDDTRFVVQQYPRVKYYYQQNKGLAAARNAGIRRSKGRYLVFLDADDWLETTGIEKNYLVIKSRPDAAFVSGNHYFIRAETNEQYPVTAMVAGDHYVHLLQSNYIGMHAAVMFQRWVFQAFQYDEDLKACEDYDLYLRIARQYPLVHHQAFIATYYFHASGLSHNYQAMMDSVYAAVKKQEPYIRSAREQQAYIQGLQQWKDYRELMQKLV